MKKSTLSGQDKFHQFFLDLLAKSVVLVLVTLIVLLLIESWPAISFSGKTFFTSDWWDPANDDFGSLSFVYGTLLTSGMALLFATPVSVAVAIFITEILPLKAGKILGAFVEMIAAVPSIVFGLWGIFYLSPWVRESLFPLIEPFSHYLPFLKGPSSGLGYMTASLILAIMITPTITSLCREVFKTVPRIQKEAALALGATRYEAIKMAIIRPSFGGIVGAVVLGLSRALGETMAVAMVIGNSAQIGSSLFSTGATLASVIANEYAEADSNLHLSALSMVGVLLFLVTLSINILARILTWRARKKS